MSIYLTDKKPIRIKSKNHAQWLENRTGIGSSDIATLMGCNKYSTPYQLWIRLRSKDKQVEEDNFLMKMGHKLEPIIAELWEEETGRKIIKSTKSEYMYVHPEFDFLRASPDREFKMDGKTNGILECKSTQIEVSQEELPPYWFCQVQYQMGIAQKEYCNIAWLISGRKFGYAEVYFNPDFFAQMVDVAIEFWNHNVLQGNEPKLESVKDIALKYPTAYDGCIESNDNILKLYDDLIQIRADKKELEEKEKSCIEQMKLYMQDNVKLAYAGKTLATWKSNSDRLTFDAKRFEEEHPELYKQYLTASKGSRPFIIK